jgi:hypothetical protein
MGAEFSEAAPPGPIGAYGLRLENVERARPLLLSVPASWPRLRVRRSLGEATSRHDWMTEAEAVLRLQNGGQIAIDRARGEARFILPRRLGTPEIVHPLLAPVAAVMAYWLGRQSFHAAAFTAAGRAWGIVGDRGAGKSTTVAQLALGGVPIVCDDMLVLDGTRALPGPRSVDLRGDAARRLGVGDGLGIVGARERWRLRVGPVDDGPTIGGWIFLAWGDRIETVPVPPAERLARLGQSRGTRLPERDPDALLDLAALPAWELRRPKSWESLADAVAHLVDAVA